MKIETPLSPQPPRSHASARSGRKVDQDAAASPREAKTAKSAGATDSVQIGEQAAALQSAAEATRTAVATRELIAKGNREAVLAQQVDVKRLQELLEATGAVRQPKSTEMA